MIRILGSGERSDDDLCYELSFSSIVFVNFLY